jgi:cyanophycinase-like exopeptidase
MVEVHKKMLARLPDPSRAVFLDTPAGFQLNVDEISRKAVEYFRLHVQKSLRIASYRSAETVTALEAEAAYQELRNADFVLFGPGSPTYAIDQLKKTPIPDILKKVVHSGGCLVAASAAALAIGRYTLPVYEIYKVGQKVHWVDGLDILSHFGIHPVIVPHWNNAEGGTHDTRFCFMGEPRFRQLQSMLPEDAAVLGIDEHTACVVDLEKQVIDIEGRGSVTVRKKDRETTFGKGESIPFQILAENVDVADWLPPETDAVESTAVRGALENELLSQVAAVAQSFRKALNGLDHEQATRALLTLENIIWNAQQQFEDEEHIGKAREILRELILLSGQTFGSSQHHLREYLSPLVEQMLRLREAFRKDKKYAAADRIRNALAHAGISIEDTESGFRWRTVDYHQEDNEP